MTPEPVEAAKANLIGIIFKAALESDKVALFKAFKQKYTLEEIYKKPDPDSPTGVKKVKRKVIKYYFGNLGEIMSPQGKSVIDVIVENDDFFFAVHLLQDEQFGILQAHPLEKAKRCFKISLTPDNFVALINGAHSKVPAQDTQRRGFIRRLVYGQQPNEEVDAFLAEKYPEIHADMLKFREKHDGKQV